MIKRYILFFTILNYVVILSCTKTVNIQIPGEDNQLVINATLCPDSITSLVLSRSKNVLNSEDIEYINNAIALVYEFNTLVDTLKNRGNGLYTGNLKPSINKTYTIKIITANNEVAEGTDSIPEIVKIQKIDTVVVNKPTSQILNCTVSFTDNFDRKNYYLLRVLSTDRANAGKLQSQNYICYDPSDVIDTLAGGNVNIFDDDQFNGKTHALLISMVYPKSKKVYFQLLSISQSFYNYCFSIVKNREYNSSLFYEKPQVKTNIKGGLGIIGAYSISTDSIVVGNK